MLSSTAKMCVEASDVQTDEDCEELAEDAFSFSADFLEKRTSRKRSSSKPPPSPKSPYLSSMNVNTRRAAVAAWRLPRASLGDTRGDITGESDSARLTSLSNGHDVSQMLRSECDVTAELLRQTLSKNHKHLHPGSNGFALSTGGYREKEDMYDEIIHLKKSVQAQKSDGQKMKAKLRRLEEELTKREKLIEELLDPTKGSEYTRSLVDKKKEGSVVINGLKQRILKLEQQCREKENALSQLQSELRTTNLEELKITAETYFDEIQRLRVLLKAAEKSSRAESKCSQRQQKVLSSTVHRLSENLKQLQQENMTLREELSTDSPAGGPKGYREWSRQRLLRRLLEVEKRLDDSSRHAQSAQHSGRLDQGVQATPTEILGFAMATEAVVSVGTNTTEREEVSGLRERLEQSKKEGVELQEALSSKDDELRRLRTEREELETETERWKAEQTNERDKERQQHQQELDQLWTRIHALTDRNKPAELSSLSATSAEEREDTEAGGGLEEAEERSSGGEEEKEGEGEEELAAEAKREEREKAALLIQTKWREHRKRDVVMLQSALRGHLLRECQLQELLKDAQALETTNCSSQEGELDEVALTTLQSAFRGHLARCSRATESSEVCVPRRGSRTGAESLHKDDEELRLSSSSISMTPTTEPHRSPESGAAAGDSDDSDDIIVSPSRPLRSREVFML